MPVLDITLGNENVEDASAKFHVFANVDGEELHISKRQCAQVGIRKLATISTEDAVPGMRHEICGKWERANYEVPAGTIIKLFAFCKQAHGDLPRTHNLFVQCMDSADLVRLAVELSGNHRCAKRVLHIVGRFHLLTLAQAETLGVRRVPPHFRGSFNVPDAHKLIRVDQVLERGTSLARRSLVDQQAAGRTVTGRTRSTPPVVISPGQVMRATDLEEMERRFFTGVGNAPPPAPAEVPPTTPAPRPGDTAPMHGTVRRPRRLL